MKKKLYTLMLLTAILLQAVSFGPRRAHAIVGGVTGNMPVLSVGGVFLALGLGMGLVVGTNGVFDFGDDRDRSEDGARAVFIAVPSAFLLAGIIMLDEESGAARLGPLSEELRLGAQLTDDELMAYQLELPELNRAVLATVSDLAAQGVTSLEETLTHQEMWTARAEGLMPETRAALRKIGEYLASR